MNNAWMPILVFSFLVGKSPAATASPHVAATETSKHEAVQEKSHDEAPSVGKIGIVVAMEAKHGRSIRAGEIFSAGAESVLLVSRKNLRAEVSPHSVVEFDEAGIIRLLRGSVALQSSEEAVLRTASARVDFVGRTLGSYDHKEKSTSAFVLEGEARMVNPQHEDRTLRLARFHGATMVVGAVLPQLVRQLDLEAVDSWLAGFAWPEGQRKKLLAGVPGRSLAEAEKVQEHLQGTKIEDYFSSIETADEFSQPNYYDKKFADPDTVVAEANSKVGSQKILSPEEAALISLPKTKIDLGFDLGILSSEQKEREVNQVESHAKSPNRKIASIDEGTKKAKKPTKAALSDVEYGDPEVNQVLKRLRGVRAASGQASDLPASGRSPASLATPIVPDPVYDYSQNF